MHFELSFAGEAYSDSGVNYERLQEEVGAKEMSTITPPVRERPDEDNHRRDDVMYFSID